MGRLLVHYDIEHQETRAVFQVTITDSKFKPQFHEVTESVYETEMTTTEENLKKLLKQLQKLLGKQHYGKTRVFIEYAVTEDGRPTINQIKVIDT